MRIEWLEEALAAFDEALAFLHERNPPVARQLAMSIHLAVLHDAREWPSSFN